MTDLVKRDPYAPQTFSEAKEFAKMVANEPDICPDSLRGKPGAVFLVLAKGKELDIKELAALSEIHVIKGKPVVGAHMCAALAKRSPHCLYFRCVESSSERVTYETHRKGSPEPERVTWTMERAREAGLGTSQVWRKHKAEMLGSRAKMELARMVYPEAVLGLYLRDEVDNYDTPAPPAVEETSAQLRRPPPAEPEPVDATYVDDDERYVGSYEETVEQLGKCETLERWRELAAQVVDLGLDKTQKSELRELFAARKAEIEGAQ